MCVYIYIYIYIYGAEESGICNLDLSICYNSNMVNVMMIYGKNIS